MEMLNNTLIEQEAEPENKYNMTVYLDGDECETYTNKRYTDCIFAAKYFQRRLGARFSYSIVKNDSIGGKPKKIN